MKLFSPTLLAALALPVLAYAADITGEARVIDGDTIVIGGHHIRLASIDAPEHDQTCHMRNGMLYPCGMDATTELRALITGQTVTCTIRDHDKYGRSIGLCVTGSTNLNREMVATGWAVDYWRYSHGEFSAEEAAAKAAKHGIWQGEFTMPEDWRHQHHH